MSDRFLRRSLEQGFIAATVTENGKRRCLLFTGYGLLEFARGNGMHAGAHVHAIAYPKGDIIHGLSFKDEFKAADYYKREWRRIRAAA